VAKKFFIATKGAKAVREMRIAMLAKPYLSAFVPFPNSPGEPVANYSWKPNRLGISIASILLGSMLINILVLFNDT
jgi:hypothetical protein